MKTVIKWGGNQPLVGGGIKVFGGSTQRNFSRWDEMSKLLVGGGGLPASSQ